MCISVSYIFMWFVCLCRMCLWRAALQCCHSWPVVFITSLCLFVHVTARSVFTRHVTRWLTAGAAPGAAPTWIRRVQVVASRRPSTGRWAELISKNIPPPTELTHPSYDACCSWHGPHFCIDPYRPIAEFAAEFLCDENPLKNSASRICRHNFLHRKSAEKFRYLNNIPWNEQKIFIFTNVLLLLLQPFNGLFSRTTWVSRYQKGKTNLDFTGARDSDWQWHQLDHMQVCTSLQTDSHASTPPLCFLQAGCPSCRPTNSVKALKAEGFSPVFTMRLWQVVSVQELTAC